MKSDRRVAIKKHLEDLKATEKTLRMTDEENQIKVGLIDQMIKKSVMLRQEEFTENETVVMNSWQHSNDSQIF